jgi:uncharacterized protein YutE (UPF0331/DUF86 family)
VTPQHISKRVVVDRLEVANHLIQEITALPLKDRQAFFSDRRNVWTAESCLRRSLEALLDVGRHILAKGFGLGISEYKEIGARLREHGVLLEDEERILRVLAGYRNRLVHFYHEVSGEELYEICRHQLGDLKIIQDAFLRWLRNHPEQIDQTL